MNKEQLFESFNEIDEDILDGSEKWTKRKWHLTLFGFAAAAACFLFIIMATFAVHSTFNKMQPEQVNTSDKTHPSYTTTYDSRGTEYKLPLWTAHYNQAASILADSLCYSSDFFTEELDEIYLAKIIPEHALSQLTCSGSADFDYDGNLICVNISVATGLSDTDVMVSISKTGFATDYILPGSPVLSFCDGIEYCMYIYEDNTGLVLSGKSKINEYYYTFTLRTDSAVATEAAKPELEQVIGCFTAGIKNGKAPDFGAITPKAIPEYKNETLTISEALNDPDFGAYMLAELPSGFRTEAIRRFINQNNNYLSGFWTYGYNQISWRVSYLSDDDAKRITTANDTANYDLNLYPIPRADSVPEELREIVDNPIFKNDELTLLTIQKRAYKVDEAGDSNDYRMHFSVLYGNIVVEISTKGVSPEWLYKQLSDLAE